MVGRVGLEAEHVVGSVDGAVAYHHSVAVYDVYAVVVPVRLAVYGDALDQQVAALVVGLVPAGGVAQGDAFDYHVVALTEIDVLRAVTLIGAAVAQRIVVESAVDDIHLVVGGLCALSVDGALATDGDVLLSEGKDERLPVDHGTLVIVPGIGRAQQFGAVFKHQRDIRLQIDGARKVTARRKHQVAASVAAHVVDGMLDDVGVERYAVGFGSEVGNAIVAGIGCDAQECAEHTEQTLSNSSHVVDSYDSRSNMAASGDC